MLREVYQTAARKNLTQEAFRQQQSIAHGLKPFVVPPELQTLSRLSAVEYIPNLGDYPEDGDVVGYLEENFFSEINLLFHSSVQQQFLPDLKGTVVM